MAGSNDADAWPSGAARRGARSRVDAGGHAPDISRPARGASRISTRPNAIERLDSVVAATLTSAATPVAIVVTSWAEPLDPLWRLAVTQALRRSAVWCVLFDGLRLRLVDASRLYARRYLEFDLDLVLDHPIAFAAFWRTFSAAVAHGRSGRRGIASRARRGVRSPRRRRLPVAARRRARRVRARPARAARRPATTRKLPPRGANAAFEQALTIVYRMLFLLFAEARALVPLWHPVYRESYSLEALRDIGGAIRGGRRGLWDALRAIARLAHAGCRAGDLRVTPFNGRLFAPARTPLAERRDLDDEAARQAVRALSSRPTPDRAGRERIAYRDLGVEQLGAVYETLLDYEPTGSTATAVRAGVRIRHPQGDRHVLHAAADRRLPRPPHARAAGPRRRSRADPAASHRRSVDGQRRVSRRRVPLSRGRLRSRRSSASGGCHAGDLGTAERSAIRRDDRRALPVRRRSESDGGAARRGCRSGWRRSPPIGRSAFSIIACRSATACSAPGSRACGMPPAKAAPRLTLPLFGDDEVAGALRDALPVRFSLESTPNDTLDQVRAKERAFAVADRPRRAAFAMEAGRGPVVRGVVPNRATTPPPAAFGALSDAILNGRGALPAAPADRYLAHGRRCRRRAALLSLGARVPGGVFRPRRRTAAGGRIRRGHRQSAVGHGARRRRATPTRARDAQTRRRVGAAVHARRRRLPRAVGAATRTGISCSSSARSRSLATADASASCCRPASPPITAARRCAGCCCPAATSTRWSASTTTAASFRSIAASGFLLVTASPGSPTRRVACRFGIEDPAGARRHRRRAVRDVRLVSRARVAGTARAHLRKRPRHSRAAQRDRPRRSSSAPRRCFRRSAVRRDGRRSSGAS